MTFGCHCSWNNAELLAEIDHLVRHEASPSIVVQPFGVRRLIDTHVPYRNLEEAKIPLHVVATDLLSGETIVLSKGSVAQAVLASTAIPAAFAPVQIESLYLADGAITCNTLVRVRRAAPDHLTDGLRLRAGDAASRGDCLRAARAHAAYCTPAVTRAARSRVRHRIFRCAAALSATRVALRFFADEQADRSCCREHPHLAR